MSPSTPRIGRAASAPPPPSPSKQLESHATKLDRLTILAESANVNAFQPTEQQTTRPRGQESLSPARQSSSTAPTLIAYLQLLPTSEERDAAQKGWDHAETKKTHESLISQFAGSKPLQVAADRGWKAHKMIVAQDQGKETFWCEKKDCITSQYLKDDSRPCVSNYFGRNKKNTSRIPNMITWCRKHYQRSGYHGRKNKSSNLEWAMEKAGLILEQLRRNEESYNADTSESLTYKITLKKSEQDRLNAHNNDKPIPVDPESKSFEAPIDILKHIFKEWVGAHKTHNECVALVEWAESKLSKDTCDDFPLFEMVPEYPDFALEDKLDGSDEEMNEVDDTDMVDSAPVTPKRTSKKDPQTPKKTPRPPKSAKEFPKTHVSFARKRVPTHGSIQKPKV